MRYTKLLTHCERCHPVLGTIEGGGWMKEVWLSRDGQRLHIVPNTILLVFRSQCFPTQEEIHHQSIYALYGEVKVCTVCMCERGDIKVTAAM